MLNIISTCRDIVCVDINVDKRCVNHSTTFDLDIWPLTTWTYKGSHIVTTKFGSNRTSTFQMRQLLHFQRILQLDPRWPLTLRCVLLPHHKCWFPCCIYYPTLVEIHQSMWKVEPNVNLFSQQTTTTSWDKVIPMCLSCWGWQHKKAANPLSIFCLLKSWPTRAENIGQLCPVLLFRIEVSFVCWESLLHLSKFKISVKSVKLFGCTKSFCKLQPPILYCVRLHGYHN